MSIKVVCKVCGRTVSGHIPKGGDGSVFVPYRHLHKLAGYCNGHLWSANQIESDGQARRREGREADV